MLNYKEFIKESLVLENRKTAKERYKKGFGKFDSEQFELLMSALPLDKKGEPKTLYADYIVNWFIQDNMIDLDEVKSLLDSYNEYLYRTEGVAIFKLKEVKTFDIFKEKTTDIIKNINDKTGSGDTIIYEDNDWIIYEIQNQKQAIRLGEYAPWCIGIDGGLYYSQYTNNGKNQFIFIFNKNALKEVKEVKSGKSEGSEGRYNDDMLNFAKTGKGTHYNKKLDDKQNFSMVSMLISKEDKSLDIKDGITSWNNKVTELDDYYDKYPKLVDKIHEYYKENSPENITVDKNILIDIDKFKKRYPQSKIFTENTGVEFSDNSKFELIVHDGQLKMNKNRKNGKEFLKLGLYSVDGDNNEESTDNYDVMFVRGIAAGGEWNYGTVNGGRLEDMIWTGKGDWVYGDFYGSDWLDGDCKMGNFEFSNWKNGTFENGQFKKGTWENGTFSSGYFIESTWKNGIWKDGNFGNSKWLNGTWESGIWKSGTWFNGTWKNGFWFDGTWKKGTWENGKWKSDETHPNER